MIYDCFLFFDELDLLELRLHILSDTVDRFVLVESSRTFSGQPKPLIYQTNRERFAAYNDRIIHVVVGNQPELENPWAFENHQRNAILWGLTACQDDDVILISDLDEIPAPEKILMHSTDPGITCFCLDFYEYFLNNFRYRYPVLIHSGPKMLHYKQFRQPLDPRFIKYNTYNIKHLNQSTTPNNVRLYYDCRYIFNGGWHFSFLGGPEAVSRKIQSFSHQEFNRKEYTSKAQIEQHIKDGVSVLRKQKEYIPVRLDQRFPAYLRNNREQYAAYLRPEPARTPLRVLLIHWLYKPLLRLKMRLRRFKYI